MEDTVPPQDSARGTLSDASVDLDLMDELLFGGDWLGIPDCSDLLQPGTSCSTGPFDSSCLSPLFEIINNSSDLNQGEKGDQGEIERSSSSKKNASVEVQFENLVGTTPPNQNTTGLVPYRIQSGELRNSEPTGNWSVEPRVNPCPDISVKERLMHALRYIRDAHRGDVLVQLWVPVKKGEQRVLTTSGQPFSLDTNCQRLMNYRNISTVYHFSAEVNSKEALGLPGRVFLGKLPEWSPDVRYFSRHEYPRLNYAQRCDVRGTLALPVFERGGQSCLGVLEIVMTTENINYRSDLENICSALQAVDLRSSEVLSAPHVKMKNDTYLDVLPEILEVLKAVCQTHGLPLAQTWIPCIQQGKSGSRHSDENYKDCVSTADAACHVNDPCLVGFYEACSDHHLLRGQGVAGKAFTTNQPCFSTDVTAFSKTEYPLSHYARIFRLRAAVAIRLRSIHTGTADFVLEFFLPVDCVGSEEQKLMLDSLSITIQQVCRSLRVVTAKELEDESILQVNELFFSDWLSKKSIPEDSQNPNRDTVGVATEIGISGAESSWITGVMEAQPKGKTSVLPASVPLEFEDQEFQRFSVTTHQDSPDIVLSGGKLFSQCKPHRRDLVKDTFECNDSFTGQTSFSNAGKATEKRRTKSEKTISLQVLRQYFAGSLKDAAKSIGVCPTTLKRICRQHGITRWPSRKIKKVGHSLRKLQVVIDSVQGVDGAFQLSSLYPNFSKDCSSDLDTKSASGQRNISTLQQDDHPESSNAQQVLFASHASASNSLSSSCSQSSGSSHYCSSGTKQYMYDAKIPIKEEAPMEGSLSGSLKRAHSEVELQLSNHEIPITLARSQSHKSLPENPGSGSMFQLCQDGPISNLLRVKVILGEEKIRFRLQPTWSFLDLKQEIAKRFNIGNISLLDLKYLDDDSEWVLLTCDADLQECIDIYRSSRAHTVKISVHHFSLPSTVSLDDGL